MYFVSNLIPEMSSGLILSKKSDFGLDLTRELIGRSQIGDRPDRRWVELTLGGRKLKSEKAATWQIDAGSSGRLAVGIRTCM